MPTDQTQHAVLFEPLTIGAVTASNRVLMAPLTRNRAHPDGRPGPHAVEYYRQRASAGLIITEATQISPMGKGYVNTPGVHTDEQAAGWKAVTDAVHEAGGRIALQLWHVGRISHTSLLPGGVAPVAPSAIQANAGTFTEEGPTPVSAPRALDLDEIPGLIADFTRAARRAKEAGFDLVEVHSANGYLLDQFLQDGPNTRADRYGGSAENRARLTIEVTEAVAGVFGADRVGVRLSPSAPGEVAFNDISDSDPHATFGEAYRRLDALGLAFLHVVERFPDAPWSDTHAGLIDELRSQWSGVYIANGGYDADGAAARIASGKASAVTFGRPFIANPDLPERFRLGAELATPDHATFYGGDHRGYTDYPALNAA